jgi:Zn-dependent protease
VIPDSDILWGPVLKEVEESGFRAKDITVTSSRIVLHIECSNTKESFIKLSDKLKPIGFLPLLRKGEDGIILTVLKTPQIEPHHKGNMPMILFMATLISFSLDGYIRARELMPVKLFLIGSSDIFRDTLVYLGLCIAIFASHELGHKLSSRRKGISSYGPYFIPGIPGIIPTFGAVIFQRDPARNRDDLVDIGFSGPFFGFLAVVVAVFISIKSAIFVPYESWLQVKDMLAGTEVELPLIFHILERFSLGREGGVYLLTESAFPSWIGCITTYLNLIPAWQLDGGHIFRGVLDEKHFRIVSWVGVAIMFATGYILMGLLVLFMSLRRKDIPGPLDDVSPVSKKSIAKMFFAVIMAVLTFASIPLSL